MKVEIRADHAVLEGYVNAVGRDSRVLASPRGRFVEQVEPGTFGKAISRGRDVELRFNHERVLGSMADDTLSLSEDAIGLKARAVIKDGEVMEKARRGELRGWSFGFTAMRDRWEDFKDGIQRRFLEEIDLREVSLLDKTPAYIATSVEERGEEYSIIEERSSEDEAEVTEICASEEGAVIFNADYRLRRLKLGGK